jgi:hypothetical protein
MTHVIYVLSKICLFVLNVNFFIICSTIVGWARENYRPREKWFSCSGLLLHGIAFIVRNLLKVKLIKNILKVLKKIKKSDTIMIIFLLYYGPPDVGVRVLPVRF